LPVLAKCVEHKLEAFQVAFGSRSAEILADIPTKDQPIVQIGEVKM
jgi:hypothetical protein